MAENIEKIITGLIFFLYKCLNLFLEGLKIILFGFRKHKNIRKILIFRVGNIGDIICAVPSMVAIRENFLEAKIVLLSSPGRYEAVGAKELLENADFLDRLIIYYQENIQNLKGILNLVRELRKEKFDLFIELPQNLIGLGTLLRNIIFAKIIGCRYAIGFQMSTLRLFRQIQSKYVKFDNEIERLAKILKNEKFKFEGISFPLPVSGKDKSRVDKFLAELNNGRLVAFSPNAKRQTNLWPLEKFADVGKWLTEYYRASIIIVGGKEDIMRTEELKEMIGEGAVNLAGKFNLLQTIELLRHCHLLVSNDTGAVHMASAAGTPVVGIYSARDFRNKWFPYGGRNVILRKEPKCHTCFLEKCESLLCLKMISTEEAKDAIKEIVNHL